MVYVTGFVVCVGGLGMDQIEHHDLIIPNGIILGPEGELKPGGADAVEGDLAATSAALGIVGGSQLFR